MEKTANNSVQNSLLFSVNCKLFLLFSFCASGKISVAKSQQVLLANRWQQLVPKKPDKYWQKFFFDFFLIAQSKDCFGLAFG